MNQQDRNMTSNLNQNISNRRKDDGSQNSVLTRLPKEFRRSFSDRLDRRYYSILASSVFLHILIAIFFLMNPPSKGDKISKMQERLARKVSQEVALKEDIAEFEFVQPEEQPEEEVVGETESSSKGTAARASKPKGSAKKSGSGDLSSSKRRGGGAGRRSKGEIAASVGSKGILALLTSDSQAAGGDEVNDILGTSGADQDLDEALSGLSGVKTGGTPEEKRAGSGSGDWKGGRTAEGGGGGGIEDLLGDLGETKNSSFSRSGGLVVLNESPLIEGGGEKGIVGRNQDEIQAVVMKHNSAIQYCYERELKRNPNLKGKLVLRITITPQGSVSKVEVVSTTLNNRKVEQCIVSRIRRWSDFGIIDPSYGKTTIRWTYALGY